MTKLISSTTALDFCIRWEPLQGGRATFLSGIENETGTIRMAGGGIWLDSDAHRYFEQQRRIIDASRRRFGSLKIFMDLRHWIVENPESVTQFVAINSELFKPEDRLAAVVGSSADKKNSRDALAIGVREAFISLNAAETWLQAHCRSSDRPGH